MTRELTKRFEEVHRGTMPELAAHYAAHAARGEIALVVGPEVGVAPEELAAFEAAGVRPYRLGRSILRTSTAGTAAAALLLTRTGRWG